MSSPIIVLVEPQLGENIGMCARAMLNCGLERLRLVRPREGWPNAKARAAAADADRVIDGVRVFDLVEEAVADCVRVMATTARPRHLQIPVRAVEAAVAELKGDATGGQVAVLFGPEASGLDNAALRLADGLIFFPTNPEFSSLNLAQAVLLLGWEWRRQDESLVRLEITNVAPAPKAEVEAFLTRLERELEEGGFFPSPDRRPGTVLQLSAFFNRAQPTPDELRMLHGVVSVLKRRPTGEAG